MDCAMSQPPSRPVSGSERTCADSGLVMLLPQPSSSFSTPGLATHTPPPAAVAAAAAAVPSTLYDAESPLWHLNDAPRAPATAGTTTGGAVNASLCSAKQQPQQQQQSTAESAPAWTPFPLPPSFTVSGGRTHTPPPPPPPPAVAPSHLHHAFMLPPPAPCAPTSAAAQQRRASMGPSANCDFAQRLRSAVHQQRSGVGCPLGDAPKHGVTPAGMRGRATSAVAVPSTLHDTAPSSSASSCEEDDTAVPPGVAGMDTQTCSMPLPTFESINSATTTTAGVPTVEHHHQHQASGKNCSAVLTPPLSPQTHQHPQQQFSPMSSVPSLSASAAACHQRQPSPKVTALLGGDGHLVDTFNVSSLAQYAFSRSIASITTRPPATASNELVRRKVDGASYINHYRVIRTLGRGACGKVKLAFDEEEKKMVAIKAVKRADTRKRIGGMTLAQKQYNAFMREIEVMKKLRHRNIVSLYEVIDDPNADKLYLVMQYVDKGVVAKVEVRANSDFVCDPVPPQQLARYAREMLTGLQYLHRHDVVHRDLKPDNILVSKDGHAYLADFGVAETFDTSYRQRMETLMAQSMATSMAMSVAGGGGRVGGPQVLGTKGTPLFIAPELWDGAKSYGKPVDMWAMGVTLFTLLVGKLPFRCPDDIRDADFTLAVPVAYGDKWLALLAGLLNRSPTARWTVEKARAFVRYYLDNTASPPSEPANRLTVTATTAAAATLALPHAPSTGEGRVLHSGSTPSFTDTQNQCNHRAEPRRVSSLLTPSTAAVHDEKQVSLSDTGSHVFTVEFLPMPEGTDEVLSPELTSAAPPTLPTPALHFMPSVLTIAPAATVNGGDNEHEGEDGAADADAGPAMSGLGSAFGSPFDTSPALARVMSDTFTPGRTMTGSSGLNSTNAHLLLSSPNVCAQSNTLAALPPMLSLQRSGASQMGVSDAAAAVAPRGRRTHHRRGNGSTLNSNSNMNAATLNSASFGARCNTRGRSREGVVDGLAVLGISRGNTSGAIRSTDTHASSRRVISPHETPSLMSDTSSATSAGAPLTTSPSSPFPPSSVGSAMNADGAESGGEEKPFAPQPQPPQCQQYDSHLSNRRHFFSASASAGRSAPAVASSGMVFPTSQNNATSVMENGPFAAGGGAAASRGGKMGGVSIHSTARRHRSSTARSASNRC